MILQLLWSWTIIIYQYTCLRCQELCTLTTACPSPALFLTAPLLPSVRYLALCCSSGWSWIWSSYPGTRHGNCWFSDKSRSLCRDRVTWFVLILGDSCICVISGTFNSSGSKSGLKEEIILENKVVTSDSCSNWSIICKHIIPWFFSYIYWLASKNNFKTTPTLDKQTQ